MYENTLRYIIIIIDFSNIFGNIDFPDMCERRRSNVPAPSTATFGNVQRRSATDDGATREPGPIAGVARHPVVHARRLGRAPQRRSRVYRFC